MQNFGLWILIVWILVALMIFSYLTSAYCSFHMALLFSHIFIVGTVKLKKGDSAQDQLQYEYVKSIFSDKVPAKSLSSF